NRGMKAAIRSSATSWGPSSIVPVRLSSISLDMTGLIPDFFRTVSPIVGLSAGERSSPVIGLASAESSNHIYAAVVVTILDAAGGVVSQQVEWNLFGQIPPGEVVSSIEAHNSNSILVGTESGRLFRLMENRTAAELTFDHNPSHAIQGIASNGTFIACFETRGVIRGNPIPGTVPTSYLYFGLVRPRSGPLNPHGLEDF